MTALRRLSHAVGAFVLGLVGTLMVLEAADVIGGRWRDELASSVETVALPTWDLWISALLGVLLAGFGMTLIAAQLLPAKKGLNTMHEVYDGGDGNTWIRGRAAINAVRHELASVDGVVDVDVRVARKRMQVELRVDDRVTVEKVENDARSRLDHGFWINLGLADFAVDLLITHHPNPPRVR